MASLPNPPKVTSKQGTNAVAPSKLRNSVAGKTAKTKSPEHQAKFSSTVEASSKSSHDLFSSNHEPDAVMTVQLLKGHCNIKVALNIELSIASDF